MIKAEFIVGGAVNCYLNSLKQRKGDVVNTVLIVNLSG
jgi:hypothetical protein